MKSRHAYRNDRCSVLMRNGLSGDSCVAQFSIFSRSIRSRANSVCSRLFCSTPSSKSWLFRLFSLWRVKLLGIFRCPDGLCSCSESFGITDSTYSLTVSNSLSFILFLAARRFLSLIVSICSSKTFNLYAVDSSSGCCSTSRYSLVSSFSLSLRFDWVVNHLRTVLTLISIILYME